MIEGRIRRGEEKRNEMEECSRRKSRNNEMSTVQVRVGGWG
jgi:hypothetical protein